MQLNINAGFNEGIKDACQLLKEYMLYVEQVRLFAKEMPLKQAVEKAVDFCIAAGILEDFLRQNRAEAIEVSIFEYNAEREMRLLREEIAADSRAAGLAEGRVAGLAAGLEEGRAEGRNQLMVSIVCKRLQLGDSPEMIADLVMEPLPKIVKICDIAAKYAPNYDVEKIVEELRQ